MKLPKDIEQRFDEKFVTYPAPLVCESWGGSEKNKVYKNQSILVKDASKPYLTVRAVKQFIAQELANQRKKMIEKIEGRRKQSLTSFEKEVREDEKNKVLNFVNSVQIATDKSMEMQKELLRKTKKPILSVGDEKDLNELAEWVFKLTKERYLKGFIDGSDLTGRLAQESKHEQQS